MIPAQRDRSERCRTRYRAWRAKVAAVWNRRSRWRLGSHRRAEESGSASRPIQAVISLARAMIWHQIRFWAKDFSGRFRKPASFAARIRSSHRARRR